MKYLITTILTLAVTLSTFSQPEDYSWTSQSRNSSESMPCGGGSIGMNVWVENNDILFYVSRAGSFDENNTMLKQGRFRIHFNDLDGKGGDFRQTLHLNEGYMTINIGDKSVLIWADVFKPVIHVEGTFKTKSEVSVSYENWRYKDRPMQKREQFQSSYKFAKVAGVYTHHDSISFTSNSITFFHRNQRGDDIFDRTVSQQGLDSVKSQMYDPIIDNTFGGRMSMPGFKMESVSDSRYQDTDYRSWNFVSTKPAGSLHITIALADSQSSIGEWQDILRNTERSVDSKKDMKASRQWWRQLWKRSWIKGEGEAGEITRNFTLFRYMLACNAHSEWPTKFNGGLFVFDPCFVKPEFTFTPDFRNWAGGPHTAQNQRLVYWPALKNGDFDILRPQLQFYKRILRNAELRSEVYWHHKGAAFTEQIENFGLPMYPEYGTKRPKDFDRGLEYNAWLEYTWDTILEFCQMALDANSYSGEDIDEYIPMIQSSVDFFDYHYRYLAKKRSAKELDDRGHLIIYPGSAGETFKMAYNPTTTTAGLKVVVSSLLDYFHGRPEYDTLASRDSALLKTIPEIPFRYADGHKMLAPAETWARVNNVESTMLYPVFPWKIYGVGRPDIETAINTWKYDSLAVKFRTHTGWKQDNIFAAELGLTEEAKQLALKKLGDGPYRFPAFWGPGYDWSPDHNWGGSGMIGLQEMLVQEAGGKIYLFPAWPKDWNVDFKLHLSRNTTIEARLKGGKIEKLIVCPAERKADVVSSI